MNNKLFVSVAVGALLLLGIVFSINQVRNQAASADTAAAVPVTGGSTGWRDSGVTTRDGSLNPAGVMISSYRDAGANITNEVSKSYSRRDQNASDSIQVDGYLDAGASRARKQSGGR